MKSDLKTRNKIAQLFVDMNVGESKPVRLIEMVPLLKEVNDTALIGHAIRFVKDVDGVVTHIKKYRKTAIERRCENKGL
tara:strand:+ start:283 stop:519 length:237 start_codon:yes stop_codon:yes gene_type:complete